MMRFLAGDSGMARMIRERDWSRHPFGRAEAWPPSLRSALSICLHSAFPTAIYWGPELRLLYNDAWSAIPGPRHPAALGAPAREVWSDIWDVIGPQFEQLLATGEGISVENQMLPMRRFGVPEETFWTYSFTAIRGEDGEIAGIFNSGSETTNVIRIQKNTNFFMELEQALRRIDDHDRAWSVGAEALGLHAGADWTAFGELSDADLRATPIAEGWSRGGDPSPVANFLADLGVETRAALAAGEPISVADLSGDTGVLAPEMCHQLSEGGAQAVQAVPFTQRQGRVFVAVVAARAPRAWTGFDSSASRETLSRIIAAAERQRAAERERMMVREIDHRARNALATTLSIIRLTHADTIDAFRERIELRVAALARAHSLLASQRWSAVDLRTLVWQELAPYTLGDEDRARVSGEPVQLAPELAQSVTLVLHELATNAAKHGALHGGDGTLAIEWVTDDSGLIELEWTETLQSPNPLVATTTPSSQFGSTLLARVVRNQLHGVLEHRFAANGLHCRVTFPLDGRPREAIAHMDNESEVIRTPAKRVLVAEDEALIAMDMETLVTGFGYQVFGTYSTVATAMESLQSDTPDLALLDARLVGESSVPLALELVGRGVPVIFATGYDASLELPEPLADLPRLSKPISEQALAAMLKKADNAAVRAS